MILNFWIIFSIFLDTEDRIIDPTVMKSNISCIFHVFCMHCSFFSNIFTHFLHELEIVGAPQGPEGGPESTISNSCKKCIKTLENNEKCMQNTWKMHDMYDFMTVGSIILSSVDDNL